MDIEEKLKLVCQKPTEEVLTIERLRQYFEEGRKIKHYIGFEISGFAHIGTGLITMTKVADFQKAGIETTIFLADWHSWLNRKLGGDLETIRKVAGGYFKNALLKCLEAVGGDPEKTKIVLGSELYEKLGLKYWEYVVKISLNTTLSRIKRSITIAGRKAGESVTFAQLLYVPMQVADIFALEVNLPHGGMDQRKAHVIAIEVGEDVAGYKPVAVHHHLLMGMHITEEQRKLLKEAKEKGDKDLMSEAILDVKMSKSKPETCIFVHDTPEEIKRKLRKAYCPKGEVELNPVWEIVEWIIFRTGEVKEGFKIVNEKTGEERVYYTYEEIKRDWVEGKIHPLDLKNAIAEWLSRTLEPVRKYFLEGAGRKYLEEMKELKITR